MSLLSWYKPLLGGHVTDNHGNYWGECVSFIKRYAQQFLKIPNADSVLYVIDDKAKNMFLHPTPATLKYFKKVSSPRIGDIAVYGVGNYGDVAVVVGPNTVVGQYGTPVFTSLRVRPLNQPGKPLGYLRLKTTPPRRPIVKRIVSAIHRVILPFRYYRVRPGDTLGAIAVHNHTTVGRLQGWNKARYPSLGYNPNFISLGWKLRIK